MRLMANIKATAIMSYRRSTMMVTSAALGLTRGSRIGSTTGRTTSPAPSIRNTALNPIAVAAKRSGKRVGTSGFRSAPQRNARAVRQTDDNDR